MCDSFTCACARSGHRHGQGKSEREGGLQKAGAHPLRGVCWHFTHLLPGNETQLFQATGLVAVEHA